MNERKPLGLGNLGADTFKHKEAPEEAPISQQPKPRLPTTTTFPSREAGDDQMNIKGPKELLDRFRTIAKRDGLRASGLLMRALDAYERAQRS